jgi:hypothetical protein
MAKFGVFQVLHVVDVEWKLGGQGAATGLHIELHELGEVALRGGGDLRRWCCDGAGGAGAGDQQGETGSFES